MCMRITMIDQMLGHGGMKWLKLIWFQALIVTQMNTYIHIHTKWVNIYALGYFSMNLKETLC